MSILLPYDVFTSREKSNTYLINFYYYLKAQSIEIKASPLDWINKSTIFSAVLIHWPENLPSINCKTEADFVNFTIERVNHFKKFSKIFYIVHNLNSHKKFSDINERLYELIIKSSNAIFHFSEYSRNLFIERFHNPEINFVIPHGNYQNLKKIKSNRDNVIEKFNFGKKNLTVSAIGAIRKSSEFDIVYKFAKEYLRLNCNFIFAGQLVGDVHMNVFERNSCLLKKLILYKLKILSLIKYYRKLKLIFLGKNIKVFPSAVTQKDISNICNKTDILIIFRKDTLNSGNIPLGFTFGCYVVGPNIGNIGELLKKYNNTVFDPKNLNYSATVKHSISHLDKKIIDNNVRVALEDWDWNLLSKEYKNIFSKFI